MATAYQQSQGSDIGTLLRLIQEEKASSILASPPAADPSSPIREQVQGPILAPEAPGGTRNVSIRPEGVGTLGPSGQAVGPLVPGASSVVAPRVPVAPTPVPTPTPPGRQQPGGVTNAPAKPSLPSIGTQLAGNLMRSVLGVAGKAATTNAPTRTPTSSRFGNPGSFGNVDPRKTVIPTPTPVQQKNAPKGAKSSYIRYTA